MKLFLKHSGLFLLFVTSSFVFAGPVQETSLPLHDRAKNAPFNPSQTFSHQVKVTQDLTLDFLFEGTSIEVVEGTGPAIVLSGTYESEHWQKASFTVEEFEEGKMRIEYERPFRFDSLSYQRSLGRALRYADLIEISKENEEVVFDEQEGKVVVGGFFTIHGDVVSLGSQVKVGAVPAKIHLRLELPSPRLQAFRLKAPSAQVNVTGFEGSHQIQERESLVILPKDLNGQESCPEALKKSQLFDF